jgi:hypothetical protein
MHQKGERPCGNRASKLHFLKRRDLNVKFYRILWTSTAHFG